MGSNQKTLLEVLEENINVDADTLDYEFVRSLPIKCHDMTSNPRFVGLEIEDPKNRELVESVIKSMPGADWKDVYATLTAKFAKRMQPYISGRVLAQTLPSNAYNKEEVIADARRYVKAYAAEGITKDRLCIKIATTSAGVQAARELKKEGIPTLGTALFSLHQAIAASQAGMHAISMYYNLPSYNSEPGLWPECEDPATQHPMSARHIQIRRTYDKLAKETGKPQPQIKTASFVSGREVMGMIELGADHVTLGKPTLEDLLYPQVPSNAKGSFRIPVSEQLAKPNFIWKDWNPTVSGQAHKRMEEIANSDPVSGIMAKDFKLASTDIDYVDERTLDKYIEGDEVTKLGLAEGIRRFALSEDSSREFITKLQKELA